MQEKDLKPKFLMVSFLATKGQQRLSRNDIVRQTVTHAKFNDWEGPAANVLLFPCGM